MHGTKPRRPSPVSLGAAMAAWCLLGACAEVGPYIWVDQYVPPQSTEYLLAPGDVINVRVYNQDAASSPRVRIRADGMVSLPLVNDVRAAGMPPVEFGKKVVSLLRAFINQPVVTVTVEEMHQIQVSVMGEVARPGVYPIEPEQGVLRVLAAAGGLTPFAHKDGIYVLRQSSPARIRIRMDQLVLPGTAAAAFRLLPNDAIVVE